MADMDVWTFQQLLGSRGGYGRTRKFYLAVGFRPLEEFPTLWGEANPCLQLIKQIA